MSACATAGAAVRTALVSASLVYASLVCVPLAAQDDPRVAETQTLRAAGTLEVRGQLAESEAMLARLLDSQPTSVGGLFALERVVRAQGRPITVLPFTARFLDADPSSTGVRYLRLRVLAEVDSLDALVRETEEWIERSPGDPAPYRDAAPLFERAFGSERSLALLRRGRAAAGQPTAFALEIGDLQLRGGRTADAAAEWARGSMNGGGGEAIVRRVAQIGAGAERERMVDALMVALARTPTALAARALAARLGLGFGRFERGLELARGLAPDLTAAQRRAFLEDVTRWGADAEAPRVTLWALTRLREGARGDDARAFDVRIAQAAMSASDTAAALAAGARLAAMLPRGSAERRRALADLIRIEARGADGDERLQRFQEEFPEAPEADELAAAVSAGLQSRGQAERAAAVIARVQGPRSALERGYLLLAEGDVAGGRGALMEAVAGLPAARVTDVLQLASLLGRLSPPGGAAVAKAAVEAHRGRGRDAGLALERSAPGLIPPDRPLLFAEAARLVAAAGAETDAARIRTALVEGFPDAPEATEAALALARWHARTPQGVGAAIRLLEDLIVRAPGSAVAPAARRELDRLRRGV